MDQIRNGTAQLSGDEARHLTQVLRVEAGEIYEISDNDTIYLAEVETARKQQVVFRTIEKLPDPEPLAPITLLIALFKFERLELLLEKATELGVGTIQFVKAERSERGLEQGALKRMPRWHRIVLDSSQQSRRQRTPRLLPPISYKTALTHSADLRLFLDEDRSGSPLLSTVDAATPASSIGILIGPEGGWPEVERSAAREAGWTNVSLGPLVLRTETAAVAALAVVNAVVYR